jgi:hypothetical protein
MIRDHYPELQVEANNKTMLDGYELDIAIPKLKLGIEWNGIVHFKPIYGYEKLASISERDQMKGRIAAEKEIHLVVISDLVSTEKYVRESFHKIRAFIDELIKSVSNPFQVPDNGLRPSG